MIKIKINEFRKTYRNGGATAVTTAYGMSTSTARMMAHKLNVRMKRAGRPRKYLLVK